ncbi:MAG: hypothetical protein KC910_17440, partial [Candidatus Eremiobacteraeota bacterium]|nr:hypothetical protein [Candidatus Eremiobacteraeota bacterium]
ENDLTKIGKFGIGFVSVFAIKPQAVTVETGRSGEAWRILFRPDRTFERIRLDHPVDGTRVAVWVSLEGRGFNRLKKDCRDTVTYWCKHCDVEVRFAGEPINQPFGLGQPYEFKHSQQGTEVVVAPVAESAPFHGYYNRGLTLLEGQGSPLPNLAFKVRSRYLEHTLTRDNVLHDDHYKLALSIVEQAAYDGMAKDLLERLAQVDAGHPLWKALALASALPLELPPKRWPAIFPGFDRRYAPAELNQMVLYADQPGELVDELLADHQPVMLATKDSPLLSCLEVLGYQPQPVEEAVFLAAGQPAGAKTRELLGAALAVLGSHGIKRLEPCRVESGPPSIKESLSVACRELGRPCRVGSGGPILGVQVEHKTFQQLLAIADHDRPMAVYLLARMLGLAHGQTDRAGLEDMLSLRRKLASPPPALSVGKGKK